MMNEEEAFDMNEALDGEAIAAGKGQENNSWLGKPPVISEAQIKNTYRTEVVVIGAGLAGVAAARRAAELGSRVIIIERCRMAQARSGDFAILDAEVAKKWNRQDVDKRGIVADLMKDMCYRVDQRILEKWVRNAGKSFDWYLEGFPEVLALDRTDQPVPIGTKCWLQPRRYPLPEAYDMEKEYYHCYQTTVWIHPTHVPIFQGNLKLARDTGNIQEEFYNTRAVLLIKDENGKVTGVIAKQEDGTYIKVLASKGVVLSTGDYSNDDAMLYHYCPQTKGVGRFWTSFDKDKQPSNTGDGHRMGIWAGARMQEEPHAPMTHHMGSTVGSSGYLLLNKQGERFVNEDCPGQQLDNQIHVQPGQEVWQIFDADWSKAVPHQTANHGAVCYVADQKAIAAGTANPILTQLDGYVSEKTIEHDLKKGYLYRADTLEELIRIMELPQETAMESIQRYNALCEKGNDEDFGKDSRRLFPVKKGPFYAAKFRKAEMLVCMGGLASDQECHCFDQDGNVISGLYVAGNVQGNRFAIEYPTTVPGISHSMALTFGRIAGENVVKEV